jgi:hypothetical protein
LLEKACCRFFYQMTQDSQKNSELLEKTYRTAMIVVSVQIAVMLVLVAASWFIITYTRNEVSDQALMALWGTILFLGLISFVLRRMLFSWERLKNIALLKGVAGLLSNLQINTILLGTLAELIAIMGFLVATLSGNRWEMFRAGAISLIVFLINFPRKTVWRKILTAAEKLEI